MGLESPLFLSCQVFFFFSFYDEDIAQIKQIVTIAMGTITSL